MIHGKEEDVSPDTSPTPGMSMGLPPVVPLQPVPKRKRDKAETFGAIVVFTPLVVTGLSFLIMAVPVVGIIGISIFLYFSLAWWVVGLASLFVLFLALWGNRQVALYGALGMLESLVLGMIYSHLPGL